MYTEPKSRAKNASVVPMAAPAVATLHAAHAQAAKAVNTDYYPPPFFFIMLPLSPSKKARNTPGFFALQNIFSHVIARCRTKGILILSLHKESVRITPHEKLIFQKECHSEEQSDVGIRLLNAYLKTQPNTKFLERIATASVRTGFAMTSYSMVTRQKSSYLTIAAFLFNHQITVRWSCSPERSGQRTLRARRPRSRRSVPQSHGRLQGRSLRESAYR